MHAYIHPSIHTYINKYIHTYIQTYIHTYTYIHIHTYILYIYIVYNIYIYIYIHIYTYRPYLGQQASSTHSAKVKAKPYVELVAQRLLDEATKKVDDFIGSLWEFNYIKSPCVISKASISIRAIYTMAMLNNQMVTMNYGWFMYIDHTK